MWNNSKSESPLSKYHSHVVLSLESMFHSPFIFLRNGQIFSTLHCTQPTPKKKVIILSCGVRKPKLLG